VTPIHDSTGANWSFSDRFNIFPCHNDTSTSSIDINHLAVSHSHDGIIQNQNQLLSVPLAQQSVNGTQQSLLRSPIQQSLIETHLSVDLSTPIDITNDTSSTLVCIPDTDINDIDNSSVTSESQSIDINSRNLNNNVSNDCGSPSIEIHNTPMLNTTLDNHLDSGNIATRVRAKNEKARKNTVHKKSQHFNARNLGNTSSLSLSLSESLS
jgi:hypothetical protein